MNIKKIAILITCILLAVLSGCTLVEVDEEKVAQREKEQPIIEYKGFVLDKYDVEKKMNYYLTPQNMTIADLSEGTDVDIWERFKHDIIFELAVFQIGLEKAEELGLNKLTASEQQNVEEAYNIGMQTARDAVKRTVDAALKEDDSLDYDEEFNRQLKEYFYLRGYDLDAYKDALRQEVIVDKVKKHFTDHITVTDAEIKQKYDYDLQVQKSNIEQQPSSIEQQMLFGTDILYYPEGYMYVKHILISFDSATRGAAAIAYVDGNIAEYNKVINEAMPDVRQKVDEIVGKLDAGDDFTEVMKQYSDDKSLNEEPFATDGFLIGPYTQFDLAEYLDVTGALKEAGQISEPTTTYMGVYIIQCVKPMSGAIRFDEVKERLAQTMVEQRKAFEWSALGERWVDAAEEESALKTYQERL